MHRNFTEKEIKRMIRRYNDGIATEAEKSFVDAYYDYMDKGTMESDTELGAKMKNHVMAHAAGEHRPVFRLHPVLRYAAAACLLLLTSIGIWFVTRSGSSAGQVVIIKEDVKPGEKGAVLTLSDGRKIALGNQHGNIAIQGGAGVVVDQGGRLRYAGAAGKPEKILYNTLTVPVGNRMDITLADGTEVNLDAGSVLTFPVIFGNKERSVTLTGQGYFKVKHDNAHPFVVNVNGIAVRDLGTEFNINAYGEDGQVKTTLFEGALKVNETLLTPGQQATAKDRVIQVRNADLEATGAWRNNDFVFHNEELHSIMKQIARWYKVSVAYDNAPENLRIRAAISRNRNLSAVLQLIQETGKVKFEIDGHKVIVSR